MGRGQTDPDQLIDLDDAQRFSDLDYVLSAADLKEIRQAEWMKALAERVMNDPTLTEIEDPEGIIDDLVNSVYQPQPAIDQLSDAIRYRVFSEEGKEDFNDFLVHRTGAFGGANDMAMITSDYENSIFHAITTQLAEGERKLSSIAQKVRRRAHHDLMVTLTKEFYESGEREMMDRLFGNIPKTIDDTDEADIRLLFKQMRDSLSACRYTLTAELNIAGARHLLQNCDTHDREFDRATLIGILMREYWPDSINDLEGAHLPGNPFHNRIRKIVHLPEMPEA